RALKIYQQLEIQGRDILTTCTQNTVGPVYTDGLVRMVGTIAQNVERALQVLSCSKDESNRSSEPRRILMFVGLRLNVSPQPTGQCKGLPKHCIKEAEELIKRAIEEELNLASGADKNKGRVVFGMAAAAHGGDLLFHEACHELDLPTRLCLA